MSDYGEFIGFLNHILSQKGKSVGSFKVLLDLKLLKLGK